MSTQFAFHLKGAGAPEGQLEAEQLVGIITSLNDIATAIARVETHAEPLGRPPRRVGRLASLLIGLVPGSTTVLASRVGPGPDAFDIDLPDEESFDQKFADVVTGIGRNERPEWVGDSLAGSAGGLAAALKAAAPEVEFTVNGQPRGAFATADIRRTVWESPAVQTPERATFVGRLYAVNLRSHQLRVQDDVDNQVMLTDVGNAEQAARLLGRYVTVSGIAVRNSDGRLTQLREARIEAADDPIGGSNDDAVVPIEQIVASAPGPDPDGGIELTDEEFSSFLRAAKS